MLAALALMHLIALHDSAGSGNPLGVSGNYDRLPFAPYFIFKDLITIFIFILILSMFVFFMPNLLGDSENYVMANPMQTPPAIVPEWYLLPFYAILRSIPNKLLGVIAMFSAILILLVMPFTDLSRSRGIQFKPLSKAAFFIFVGNFLILMELGAKHVESPFIEFGQVSTVIYFAHFLIIVPLISLLENTFIEIDSKKNVNLPYYMEKATVYSGWWGDWVPLSDEGRKRVFEQPYVGRKFDDGKYTWQQYMEYYMEAYAEKGTYALGHKRVGYDVLFKVWVREDGMVSTDSPLTGIFEGGNGKPFNWIPRSVYEQQKGFTPEQINKKLGLDQESKRAFEESKNEWLMFEKARREAKEKFENQLKEEEVTFSKNQEIWDKQRETYLQRWEKRNQGYREEHEALVKERELKKRLEYQKLENTKKRKRHPDDDDGDDNSGGGGAGGGPPLTDGATTGGPSSSTGGSNNNSNLEYYMENMKNAWKSLVESIKSLEDGVIPQQGDLDLVVLHGNIMPYLFRIIYALVWSLVLLPRIPLIWYNFKTYIPLYCYNFKRIITSYRQFILVLLSVSLLFAVLVFSASFIYTNIYAGSPLHCDAPRPWGIYFQDSATPQMEALVELHDNILFYLVIILFGVGWLLISIVKNYTNTESPISHKYLSHGTLIELIWTITPTLILILIAFPSFKLLYLMDEVSDPAMVVLAEGHQWYWSYQYPDFLNSDDEFIEFDSYLVPESDLQDGALRMLEVDNRLIIPELTHVRFIVTGADVILI